MSNIYVYNFRNKGLIVTSSQNVKIDKNLFYLHAQTTHTQRNRKLFKIHLY